MSFTWSVAKRAVASVVATEKARSTRAPSAAIRAGYSGKRADAIGYENLRKPEIAKAVQAAPAKEHREPAVIKCYGRWPTRAREGAP